MNNDNDVHNDCIITTQEFPNSDDTYYLAHCYPYSFTDLKEDLELLMNNEERSKVTRREVMCETRAGNSCFLLTITNFGKWFLCSLDMYHNIIFHLFICTRMSSVNSVHLLSVFCHFNICAIIQSIIFVYIPKCNLSSLCMYQNVIYHLCICDRK